jgi:hypothetical protein
VKLYRLVRRDNGGHLYTVNDSEVQRILDEYNQEQIYYVCDPSGAKPAGTTELYRLYTKG